MTLENIRNKSSVLEFQYETEFYVSEVYFEE